MIFITQKSHRRTFKNYHIDTNLAALKSNTYPPPSPALMTLTVLDVCSITSSALDHLIFEKSIFITNKSPRRRTSWQQM